MANKNIPYEHRVCKAVQASDIFDTLAAIDSIINTIRNSCRDIYSKAGSFKKSLPLVDSVQELGMQYETYKYQVKLLSDIISQTISEPINIEIKENQNETRKTK